MDAQFRNFNTKRADGCYVLFERDVLKDEYLDTSYLEQDGLEDRLAAYQRGDFYFVGVRAVACCVIVRAGVGTYQNIESPGVWGIESNCGEEHINQIYEEEKE